MYFLFYDQILIRNLNVEITTLWLVRLLQPLLNMVIRTVFLPRQTVSCLLTIKIYLKPRIGINITKNKKWITYIWTILLACSITDSMKILTWRLWAVWENNYFTDNTSTRHITYYWPYVSRTPYAVTWHECMPRLLLLHWRQGDASPGRYWAVQKDSRKNDDIATKSLCCVVCQT